MFAKSVGRWATGATEGQYSAWRDAALNRGGGMEEGVTARRRSSETIAGALEATENVPGKPSEAAD